MQKTNWTIKHYQGAHLVEEIQAPGRLGQAKVTVLLQRLAARHLDMAELIAGVLPRNAPGYRSDCEVTKNQNSKRLGLLTGGTDHHYVATRRFS